MNGRKAKQLRKRATAITLGQPKVAHRIVPDTAYSRPLPSLNGETPLVKTFTGQIELVPECTRAVYKRLKSAA